MAAESAVEQFVPEGVHLKLVPPLEQPDNPVYDCKEAYVLVDSIPAIAEARREERTKAEALLERRSQESRNEQQVPVNVLSTARRVNEARRQYGEESFQYQELYLGLFQDNLRLEAEWERKLSPEYFAPLEHDYDDEAEDFLVHGIYTGQMTENAIIPMPTDPEREGQRVQEHIEEKTTHIIRAIGGVALIGSRKKMRMVTECTDKAINDYQADMAAKRPYQGYQGEVPEIEKVKYRDWWIDDKTGKRYQEEVAVSGLFHSPFVIRLALERRGLEVANMSKNEMKGSQFFVKDDLIDFLAYVDDVAGEQYCTNVFLGEEVPKDFKKDYEAFRRESRERQANQGELAAQITAFELALEEDGVPDADAAVLVDDFVKLSFLEKGKEDSDFARQMFNEETVQGLEEVRLLESQGYLDQASARMAEVQETAAGGGSCGGGSCGLESVDLNSADGQLAKEKLDAKEGDMITKDKVRSCKNCGEKKLYYAHNATKVNTWCKGCDAKVKKTSYAPSR